MTDAGSLPKSASGGRRARWLRVAAGSLLTLLLLAAAGVTWLANDQDLVRRTIENTVSKASGRPFVIEGDFDYTLGRTVQVRAAKIRWRDDAAETSPLLLEIERFSGAFDLWSLIHRPVRVTDFRASQARVWLDWGGSEGFNWDFRPAEAAGERHRRVRDPLPLVIERAAVEDVSLRMRHRALKDELEILITEARHQEDASHRLVVSGEAELEGRKLALAGRIGPFPELAVAGSVDFDLKVIGPLASVAAAGKVASLAQLQDLNLTARLQAPSASDLAQRLKLRLDTTGVVDLSADVSTEGEGIRIEGGGAFGEFEVETRIVSDNLKTRQGLEARVRSSGPSARDLAAIAGLPGLPDAPYRLEAEAKRTLQGLELQQLRLETTGLTVDGTGIARDVTHLRDIDLRMTAEGADFGVIAGLIDRRVSSPLPFQLNATIVGHGPETDDEIAARLVLGDATATLTGYLSETPDLSGSELQFRLDAPDAGQLAGLVGINASDKAKLMVRGSTAVTAQQVRVDDLVATLDEAELSGTASFERNRDPPAFVFTSQVKGPDLAAAAGALLPERAATPLPHLDFAASAELRLAQKTLKIALSDATVGGSTLAFRGQVDTAKAGRNLVGDVSAEGDDLGELLGELPVDDLPVKRFDFKSRLRLSPGALRLEALDFTGSRFRVGGGLGFVGEGYSRVEFDLTGSGEDLTALIPETTFYGPPAEPFDLAARGVAGAASIAVEHLGATIGGTRLSLSGEVELRPSLEAKQVHLEASGTRLSELGRLGDWQLTDRPFTLVASLRGGVGGQHIEALRFESDANNLTGRVRRSMGPRPVFEVELASTRLVLDELRVPMSMAAEPEEKAQPEGRVFSDEPLRFDLLERFDADLRLRIDDLVSHQRRWRNLAAEVVVAEGVVEIRHAQVDAAKGKLRLRGRLEPTPAGRQLMLEVSAEEAMLASADMTAEELDRLPRHAISARLSATGNSPHELAASADGFIWIVGGQGEVRRAKLGPIFGDFLSELSSAIVPAAAQKQEAAVDCDGVYLEIEQGKVTTAPAIVAQTEHVVVFAVGSVDLETEKIDVVFETTPLRGIGVSVGDLVNPFTKLTGTLRAPQITLDPAGTLIEGGAAVATGGLTILIKSLWKRWFGSRQICEKVGNKAVELRRERDPGNVPDLTALMAGTGVWSDEKREAPEPEPVEEKRPSLIDEIH